MPRQCADKMGQFCCAGPGFNMCCRVLATSSTDGLIELIPSMALEKILHDSPFRSINKYLAHYHADPSGLNFAHRRML